MIDTIRFVFWNIHQNEKNIVRILEYGYDKGIHIIAMCEVPYTIEIPEQYNGYMRISHIDRPQGVEVYVISGISSVQNYYREKRRVCFLRLEELNINLVIAHLNSDKVPSGKEARSVDINMMKTYIDRMEKRFSSKHTLIVGDLNIGLFDEQMLYITGFNAKLFKYQLTKEYRTVHDETCELFYNPMLEVYKDTDNQDEPRGTYYYANAHPQWHCYDHVLLKQSLLQCFDRQRLKILNQLGTESLVKNNKTVEEISDHLPVFFEIYRGYE